MRNLRIINYVLTYIMLYFLDILPNESDMSKNSIYLDHCYYKYCPPNTSNDNQINESFRETLSSKIQQLTSK
jgi:hypothetical protein